MRSSPAHPLPFGGSRRREAAATRPASATAGPLEFPWDSRAEGDPPGDGRLPTARKQPACNITSISQVLLGLVCVCFSPSASSTYPLRFVDRVSSLELSREHVVEEEKWKGGSGCFSPSFSLPPILSRWLDDPSGKPVQREARRGGAQRHHRALISSLLGWPIPPPRKFTHLWLATRGLSGLTPRLESASGSRERRRSTFARVMFHHRCIARSCRRASLPLLQQPSCTAPCVFSHVWVVARGQLAW